jgi:Bacterial Ig domain/RTX calcium-binding nonapeptide repeat (4 copies)/FG-GAP repeat
VARSATIGLVMAETSVRLVMSMTGWTHGGRALGGRALGGWALGWMLGGALGCADDGGVTPADTGSSTGTTGSTSASTLEPDSTGSTGASLTGLDSSAGSTSGTTVEVDSTGTTASSSTGEPNLPPAPSDDVYFIRADVVPLMVDAATGVLANDVEPEGQALAVESFDAVSTAGGTVVMQPDGAFVYTPAAGFLGDDDFGYVASDEGGASTAAVVRITVGTAQVELADVAAGGGGFAIDGALVDQESGWAVSGGGDVDGDGLDDLLVTSIVADADTGRAWVVYGKADGTAVDLADVDAGMGGFAIAGELPGDEAGYAAAIVDDMNGDGLADVLLGAPLVGAAGRAYLVHGKADGTPVDLTDVALGMGGFVLEGAGTGEDAGSAVAGAGDVNGDGLGDLLVGAPQGGPIPSGGRTYVVFGKADTSAVLLSQVFTGMGGFAIYGAGFDDESGASVAGAGDVNADGLADVLVGAHWANAGGLANSGRCYVVFGKTTTTVVPLSTLGGGGFVIDGETDLDEACTAVGGLGDVNGDGRSDVAVGAPYAQGALAFQGRAYVVFGKTDSAAVLLTSVVAGVGGYALEGEDGGDFLGQALAGPGDMDGDGYADLLVGAPNVAAPGPLAGRGYVAFGKDDGVMLPLASLTTRLQGYRIGAEATQDQAGWSVARAGDVDGDGFADAVISAPRFNGPAGPDAGRSYVVLGGNHSGALTHLGDAGADVLVGTNGMDFIVAGAGDDEVHGEGGADVIYGGAGDDRLALRNAQFFRVDGGSGFDTLAFDDGGVQLDLGVIPDVALRDFEVIDITGDGDNVLHLALRDLRAIVGPSRTLRVEGDDLDQLEVDLMGAGFADMGVTAGVHRWSNGGFTLEVVEPLVPMVLL